MESVCITKLVYVVPNTEISRIWAKLVLGYHLDVSPETVYLEFARTNQYLKKEYEILQSGQKPIHVVNLAQIIKSLAENYQQSGILNRSLVQDLMKNLGVPCVEKSQPMKRTFTNTDPKNQDNELIPEEERGRNLETASQPKKLVRLSIAKPRQNHAMKESFVEETKATQSSGSPQVGLPSSSLPEDNQAQCIIDVKNGNTWISSPGIEAVLQHILSFIDASESQEA
ncbi:uncharacterized protein LOC132259943 [Phlebotomus argentipes]|uniref:uncharacterized protein LOC132259943 n=1 Tax=Phlebotomus argentipes TaxID=94469 RepID=UPI002893712D|nr:uncharacterized protein LOC132259943 [Phlebotomus argentipes]